MAMSTLDSSRVFARWEDVHVAVNIPHYARPTKKLSRHYINDTQAASLEASVAVAWTPADEELLWDMAQVGCPPDSPARNDSRASNPSSPHDAPNGLPYSSFRGYVQNVTSAKDLCHRLSLHEIHGVFKDSLYLSATHQLMPIFGGIKLPLSNDILIPSAAHIAASLESDTPLNAMQKNKPFEDKSSVMVWHGVRRERNVNSTHDHQERFVATLDTATVRELEMRPEMIDNGLNLAYTAYKQYRDMATDRADIATWLGHVASVELTDPPCIASECEHGHRIYKSTHHATMEQQLKYKLLADIDGESPSSRFHDILRSTSAPVKATIFNEWHDSRLIPWLHYIPMDPSFIDVYGILDYFLGNGKVFRAEDGKRAIYGAHEEAAHKIAVEGKKWADKVLRAEDMQVYTLRLLLEYARLYNDNRTRSG
ncbi:hypothetical protein BDU57DRAFT_515860 [Ampelomyces quisqualis]|uniref:Glycosyl transferase CAP10 domain-containing protein n=1 Tax=Ampelomyces quisqualis TaxID=50730 RepID=A0A6A5QNE0_AMPQU|nr:hypothetical protein BDU57DRAFT_515860 [Ampelomyces quisqualis]